jgi:hypothetical protein
MVANLRHGTKLTQRAAYTRSGAGFVVCSRVVGFRSSYERIYAFFEQVTATTHNKKFHAFFRECSWSQNNKCCIVAFSFARPEPEGFLNVTLVKGKSQNQIRDAMSSDT